MTHRRVEFFFDVGSPASYLAWTQLPRICAAAGAELAWRPMLLGGVFQATGNASPAAVPAKGRYSSIDLARHAQRYGVPLVMNPHFPIITLFLMRAVTGVQVAMPERLQDLLGGVFRAIWVEALDLNDPALAVDAIARAGLDAGGVTDLAHAADTKARLRATTEEAVARGVFGAPTMFVGSEMYFGQDRLDFVREALA
ncbi:MAG: 2-hydroxychromene-2-carboxylate isomerase [Proteobacteria bacterium]|nr:2-hydroxychromene-2-carboxylate isomerase [Pseudomonadota bacterium]